MQIGTWQRATGTDFASTIMKILFTLLQETPESAETISFFFQIHPSYVFFFQPAYFQLVFACKLVCPHMYVIPEFPVMQVSFEEFIFMGIFFVSEGLLNKIWVINLTCMYFLFQ